MMVGAGAGHAGVVAVLLSRGASPLKWDGGGRCAVHHAAAQGRPDILRALLEAAHSQAGGHGQLDNLSENGFGFGIKPDGWRRTPLHLAAEEGHVAVIEALLARCVDGTVGRCRLTR